MAFTSGVATDYIDLADKLRTWLTVTAGWTQLAWTPGNVATGGMNLSLRAPGAATDKQVFVNIQSKHDDSAIIYGWDMRGAISYNAALAFGNQDGESTFTFLSLWKSSISYWFYANDRRVIIICKVNTVYVSAYLGFFLPWATPAEYPFPLYIAGSDGMMRAYNSTDAAHSSICDPGGTGGTSVTDFVGGKLRLPSAIWQTIRNRRAGSANDYYYGNSVDDPVIWPYSIRSGNSGNSTPPNMYVWTAVNSSSALTSDAGVMDNLVATAQNERLLLPVLIMNSIEPGGFGALDGIYYPMGQGLTPEQVATFGTRNFRMFPNIHRTSGNDFFAVEEI